MTIILTALKKEKKELRKKYEILAKKLNREPAVRILEAHREFSQFLEDFKGEERLTKKAADIFDKIFAKKDKAEKEMKIFDANKISKELLDTQFKLEELNREIYGIEYRAKNK